MGTITPVPLAGFWVDRHCLGHMGWQILRVGVDRGLWTPTDNDYSNERIRRRAEAN
jgi:hypothetical protein